MAQFRNKTVVDAIQWEGNIESEDDISNFSRRPVTIDHGNPDYLMVEFPDKIIVLDIGHWLIKESKGDFHVCDSGVFLLNYEPVL